MRMQSKTDTDSSLASALQRVYNEFRARVDALESGTPGMTRADARAAVLRRLDELCSSRGPYGLGKVIKMINDGKLWTTDEPNSS